MCAWERKQIFYFLENDGETMGCQKRWRENSVLFQVHEPHLTLIDSLIYNTHVLVAILPWETNKKPLRHLFSAHDYCCCCYCFFFRLLFFQTNVDFLFCMQTTNEIAVFCSQISRSCYFIYLFLFYLKKNSFKIFWLVHMQPWCSLIH